MTFEHTWPEIPAAWPPVGAISPSRHALSGLQRVLFPYSSATVRDHSAVAAVDVASAAAFQVAAAHQALTALGMQAITLHTPSRVDCLRDLYPTFLPIERSQCDARFLQALSGDPGVMTADGLAAASAPECRFTEMPWSLVRPGLNEIGVEIVVRTLLERLDASDCLDLHVDRHDAVARGGGLGLGWPNREIRELTTLHVSAHGRTPQGPVAEGTRTRWSCSDAPIDARIFVTGMAPHADTPLHLLWWLVRLFRAVTVLGMNGRIEQGDADIVLMDSEDFSRVAWVGADGSVCQELLREPECVS